MDDTQEQDHYVERLKDVFNSFDASGCGSLCPEELSDLCQSLQLDDGTPTLLHTLLQNQDPLTARVDFDQFKNALILVLSSTLEPPQAEQETKPESPEIQPKFVKGSKRYGRRSTPEFTEPFSDLSEVRSAKPTEEEDPEENYDSAVPRKRERWNAHETSTEEYEAEGQMHLWNPDEPSTPRRFNNNPLSSCSEERLREACDELAISWDGCAGHTELLALCEHLGLELNVDVFQSLTGDGVMNVQEFVSRVVNHRKPPTPSASTPYRQLKRHHSTQTFDEGGRRIATPSALTSTIGMRLFSTLDDGTGFTPVEYILDAWMEEGIENSTEILQALNFSLDGKLSLCDLTMALENELLITKNGIHQAALASFKAEIRHLLERVDRELREKEKIRSDLEKAERLKTQFATEVDEHHSAIEHTNNLNLRKLEQDHKEKLTAVRSDLMKEMEQLQLQAGLQREELEAEVQKIREDESFLRDHLSISVKENRRLEMELLDSNEKLLEAQSEIAKLQTSVDSIMRERFGDFDPGSADFFGEERIKRLQASYETQFRELQDRIDELQSELQEVQSLGRIHQPCHKPLSEELESKSPGMESDPGIGSEDVQPFSMSLEAEMMLEQLKEQHLQEMEDLQNQLEIKSNEFDKMFEKQRVSHDDQKASLVLQYEQEIETLREDIASIQSHAQELQSQLKQLKLEQIQARQREELENLQREEVGALRQELLEARTYGADLEEQLKTIEAQQIERDEAFVSEMGELRERHAVEIKRTEEEHIELSGARLAEERQKLQEEKAEMKLRLLDDFEREKQLLQQNHKHQLKASLEEAAVRFEEERHEIVQRLTEQWQEERAQLDEQNNESLQLLLEEEMLRLIREQEEREAKLREQWESERARLQERQDKALLDRILQERIRLQEQFEQRERKLKEEWETERLQLEEDYEGMLQERLGEERSKFETETEQEEERRTFSMAEEMACLEESHRKAVKELTVKHTEERDALSNTLDKLRDAIAQERKEIEISFSQRIKEVEEHFSGDQESVAKHFQADILKLERRYQSELEALSGSHVEQKRQWEGKMEEALDNAARQRQTMEEGIKQERDSLSQQWRKERQELESLQQKKMNELVMKNHQLQNELDEFITTAQAKEIELSRQLNDVHNRLQESLENRDERLAQSEKKALEAELLLIQTAEDFKQERAELLGSQSELEAKNNKMLSIYERQSTERTELLTERDVMKTKVEELETLLKQAADDFEREVKELQEHVSTLELRDGQGNYKELIAERDMLKIRIMELEVDFSQGLSLAEKAEEEEESHDMDTLKEISVGIKHLGNAYEENVTNDDCGEGTLEVKRDPAESEEHNGQMFVSGNEDTWSERDPGANCRSGDIGHESYDDCDPDSLDPDKKNSNADSNVSQEMQFEADSSLEASEVTDADKHDESEVAIDSFEQESESRDVPALVDERPSRECEPRLEVSVEPSVLEETDHPDELTPDAEVTCLPGNLRNCGWQVGFLDRADWTAKIKDDRLELDEGTDWEESECSLLKLQFLYNAATEENLLLHEKISLFQQKTEILENLLAHNSEKVKTGHQVLEENYNLKVKILLLTDQVKKLEIEALMMACLRIRYEDSMCDNAKLRNQNRELKKRVWSLESRILHDFQDSFKMEEIGSRSDENCKMLTELKRPVLSFGPSGSPTEESLWDLTCQLEVQVQATTDRERRDEFERESADLRGAIAELQDKSQTLNETTHAHRTEAGRLAEENLSLRQKLATLKEEELKETQEELIQTLEHFRKERIVAQRAEDNSKKQISELRLRRQQLEDENQMLSEKDAQSGAEMEYLQQQLAELIKENERKEAFPAKDKTELAACVSALETELTKALEDTAQLEERNTQLSQQLSGLRERTAKVEYVESQLSHLEGERKTADKETQGLRNQLDKAEERGKMLDDTLQAVNRQSARLKSDLRGLQQERDSLKHNLSALHKRLQNVSDKNHALEMALHSSGLHNQSKKRFRNEVSRLMEQQQQQLRQENERLHAEVDNIRGDLVQSREKVRQLDATVVSLRQHKQSSAVAALEQENASLRQELEEQTELTKGREAGQGHAELESLRQENEALKAQMARLSTQLIDTFQAHFVGLLPPSPHRMPRGQHRGDDQENMQDERERKMRNMEERMREIELSLQNVKLLLKEKAAQLKEQLHKHGKAEVLINDLYEENAQLLKALDITEQRQKITEKKNYLLEEKISSLNKIVRDLNPTSPHYPY